MAWKELRDLCHKSFVKTFSNLYYFEMAAFSLFLQESLGNFEKVKSMVNHKVIEVNVKIRKKIIVYQVPQYGGNKKSVASLVSGLEI